MPDHQPPQSPADTQHGTQPQNAAGNAQPVIPGQIWKDNDPRCPGRYLLIENTGATHAECRVCNHQGQVSSFEQRRAVRRIRLDRFRPVQTGYVLWRDEHGHSARPLITWKARRPWQKEGVVQEATQDGVDYQIIRKTEKNRQEPIYHLLVNGHHEGQGQHLAELKSRAQGVTPRPAAQEKP